MKVPIRLQVENIVGEKVYSPVRVLELMMNAGLQRVPSDYSIRKYASNNKLGVTPHELGIECSAAQGNTYFIKSSNLADLISGLELPISVQQLEEAL